MSERLPSVDEIILSKPDLWGEAAMRQPNGPDYEFLEPLLPTLRYVNTTFRHYPIVLGAPGALCKARYIGNGSGINLSAEGAHGWKDVGFPVTLRIGPREALYGGDLHRFDGPHYAEGYLPIVQSTCRDTGCTYAQEAFAAVDAPLADHGTVLVKFTLPEGEKGDLTAHVRWRETPMQFSEDGLRDDRGRLLVWLDGTWRWDPAWHFLKAPLLPGKPVYLAVSTEPRESPETVLLDGARYEKERQSCVARWNAIVQTGMTVEAPEPVVNNAWRSLLVGTYQMLRDDQMCYSAHNQYEKLYVAESGDAIRGLILWGHRETVRRTMPPLLDYSRKGLEYHQAGFKLQLLAQYFWLTRDAEFLRLHRDRWAPDIERILDRREPETGLFPRERYCADVPTPVYTLNSNANGWRGLRDAGALLSEIGEPEEGERLLGIARQFRENILQAVAQSEFLDTDPPFIPLALFGEETPYDPLTANKGGSYWDLMAPYLIGSGLFAVGPDRGRWIIEYLQKHGGICMGMIRCRPNMEFWVNKSNVNDLYTLRYTIGLLQNDDVDRALVSFYGKLAHGMSRETFLDGEASCLVPADEFGRQFFLPPNCASNAYFLWMLRYLLVQDWDADDDGKPDTLNLMFATPRRWLEDGKSIRVRNAPTAFGTVSLSMESRLNQGEVLAEIDGPEHVPTRLRLRARLPHGWRIASATLGNRPLDVDPTGAVDLTGQTGTFTVRFQAQPV